MSEPDKIGRFEIKGVIGRGGMGVVYLAYDPMISREVAVKRLYLKEFSEAQAKEIRERFRREAIAAGRLNHPYIITVYDVGEHDGEAFIAMEYVKGESLDRILSQEALLPLDKVAEIIDCIAQALDHAHDQKIVHRDIKPGNILLPEGGGVKVTDFGVARIDDLRMTREGAMLGSPSYMSPEQVLGKTVDRRSDIFSLGVILYMMLTGEKPFPGDSLATVSYRIVQEPATPPSQLVPSLDKKLDDVIAAALAKDPAKRYQRAGDLASDLKIIADENPDVKTIASTTVAVRRDGTIPTITVIPIEDGNEITGAPQTPAKSKKISFTSVATLVVLFLILILAISRFVSDGRDKNVGGVQAVAPSSEASPAPINVVPRTYTLWRDAQAALAENDLKRAAQLFSELTMLSPEDAEAQLELGKVQQKSGDKKAALESYRRAMELDSKLQNDPEFVKNLIALLNTSYRDDASALLGGSQAGEAAEKALMELAAGDNAILKREALGLLIQTWERKLTDKPNDADVMGKIADAYYKLGKYPEAFEKYAGVFKIRPQAKTDPLIILSVVELLDGRNGNEASSFLINTIGPPALEPLRKASQDKSSQKQKRVRETIAAILERQTQTEPANADAPFELAILRDEDGDTEAAIKALSIALNRNAALAGDPKTTPMAMKGLESENADATVSLVVNKLGKKAVPSLVNLLKSENHYPRWNAKTALEKLKESSRIDYLDFWSRELADRNTTCPQKKTAVNALVAMNNARARQVFDQYVADSAMRRCGVAEFIKYSVEPESKTTAPKAKKKAVAPPPPAPPAEVKPKSKTSKIIKKIFSR